MKNRRTVLVTGGAGFIGSNFIPYFLNKHPDYQVINLDKLTYAGSKEHLIEVKDLPNYQFVHGDITDHQLVQSIFESNDIDGVIHFAAESHVDRSIADATQFVHSNVLGTMVLLQAAKQDWEQKNELQTRRFHHISTDEVYGSLGFKGKFSESTPYQPRNPYSASKAGADMLVNSFGYTYGMNIVISHSSNNFGPKQNQEKLIPTIIYRALHGEPIPIYGDGSHIRDWLYVKDHCEAIDRVYHDGSALESYNIGGGNEYNNTMIAQKICSILDNQLPELTNKYELASFTDLITYVNDRPGHDQRYALNDEKIRTELGWKPTGTFDKKLQQTVESYVNKWLKTTLS
ncbi:dTDP-glucose 4,6-dehydratase [Virgibacillus pantothenticus]|uniref:dTDP-glucose 4,6-dehydratase n=1 Tax=Virgibacillus pantothenticus TaxID=1473 RepID=A0A0L0QMZ6_VIRPA|nr:MULTISPECIES: dTDP-glucose 4,6-dehydratase [Virgibacillus]API93334.1 dTDP-glucose 4,6-dehydratase [Virgibacillus sp. 6R]KNE19603.1 spore coat protein [Virgibacillus pantothenticus]MBS7428612.1 dTDP-glucose 4,6-dehydratase [Virgibacillus sp. 19R1-5]MBU8565859.1 dTDP-glucose 4,6-dehydratase [Virgibacillus pantothenticus]MBU8599555.1 dTDP-glucose 4,6-dehydratase [Virgibacillus pantothenticus]